MSRFAAGEEKDPRRQQRRGQLPPSSRSGNAGSNKRARGAGNSWQTQGTPANGDPQENVKMTRQAAEFDERRPANIDQYFLDYEKSKVCTFATHAFIASHLSQQVELILNSNKREHPCCSAETGTSCLQEVKKSIVYVVDFDHRFTLTVPILRCRHCNEIVTVHPYAIDCVPTAPTENCETWIRRSVVHFFRDLHKSNGLSANGKYLALPPCAANIKKSLLLHFSDFLISSILIFSFCICSG